MNDPERIHIFFVKHIVHTIELFGRVTGPAENFSALINVHAFERTCWRQAKTTALVGMLKQRDRAVRETCQIEMGRSGFNRAYRRPPIH